VEPLRTGSYCSIVARTCARRSLENGAITIPIARMTSVEPDGPAPAFRTIARVFGAALAPGSALMPKEAQFYSFFLLSLWHALRALRVADGLTLAGPIPRRRHGNHGQADVDTALGRRGAASDRAGGIRAHVRCDQWRHRV
jgi:hypothetical protein